MLKVPVAGCETEAFAPGDAVVEFMENAIRRRFRPFAGGYQKRMETA